MIPRPSRLPIGALCWLTACAAPSATIAAEDPASPWLEIPESQPVHEPHRPSIERGECPAQLGTAPVAYFEGRVWMHLPKGVTEDNFVEFQPAFARSTVAAESTNCHPDMPGAMINFMVLTMFEDDPSKRLAEHRTDILEALGYPADSVLVERAELPDARAGLWVYEIPAMPEAGTPDPAKMLLSMRAAHGNMFVIVYEVHPNAWSVIVNTLVQSALSTGYTSGSSSPSGNATEN